MAALTVNIESFVQCVYGVGGTMVVDPGLLNSNTALVEAWVCASHCAKPFTETISFNPHNKSLSELPLLFLFNKWQTWGSVYLACLRLHSYDVVINGLVLHSRPKNLDIMPSEA